MNVNNLHKEKSSQILIEFFKSINNFYLQIRLLSMLSSY